MQSSRTVVQSTGIPATWAWASAVSQRVVLPWSRWRVARVRPGCPAFSRVCSMPGVSTGWGLHSRNTDRPSASSAFVAWSKRTSERRFRYQ
ncbi:hypothetical protein A4U61_08520 [Streptomyces sp. H-KF8]|nr:hypothetical protein A4U61_08520 [Streptomyces sp. H-KF8]